jgi:hypothetical protein
MGVSAFVAIVGAGTSVHAAAEQKKATKQQVQAQKVQQAQQKKLADIKAQRGRRKLIQDQLRAKSTALAASGEQGSDSRTAGVLGSIGTKGASATSFLGQQEQVADSIFEHGLIASSASANIASAQAIGQLGGAISSSASIFKD